MKFYKRSKSQLKVYKKDSIQWIYKTEVFRLAAYIASVSGVHAWEKKYKRQEELKFEDKLETIKISLHIQ